MDDVLHRAAVEAAALPPHGQDVPEEVPGLGLLRLRARLGLPASLTEAGVPREAVSEAEADVLKAALADPCASQAPAPLTHDALQALLRQVL